MAKEIIQDKYEWKWPIPYTDVFPVLFTIEESKIVKILDLPDSGREIGIINENRVHQFFGHIKKNKNQVKIHISYSFRFEDWSSPLTPAYHVDLLKRVVEWRKEKNQNINDLEIGYHDSSLSFSYNIKPEIFVNTTLYELYIIGKEIDDWSRNIVFELQETIGKFYLNLSNKYSIFNLLDDSELLEKLEHEGDSNNKGKLLEEFICRLFHKIEGFEINERVLTATEEIDILILNKSKSPFWQKESPLILIECKNWSSKCGKDDVVVFREKIKNRYGRAKIGFFISWNGYTKKFDKELIRKSGEDIIVIPITGEDVKKGIREASFQDVVEGWWFNTVSK